MKTWNKNATNLLGMIVRTVSLVASGRWWIEKHTRCGCVRLRISIRTKFVCCIAFVILWHLKRQTSNVKRKLIFSPVAKSDSRIFFSIRSTEITNYLFFYGQRIATNEIPTENGLNDGTHSNLFDAIEWCVRVVRSPPKKWIERHNRSGHFHRAGSGNTRPIGPIGRVCVDFVFRGHVKNW